MKAMSERAQLRRMTKNEAKEDRGLCTAATIATMIAVAMRGDEIDDKWQ